jgi:diguanylate cyclase (GGDEF)-like protein/PAS domain S-box-containing protein
MIFDNQTLAISLFIVAALYAGLGLLVWSRRPGLAITSFAWMVFSLAIWSLGYGLEFMSPLLSGKITATTLEFFGVAGIAVLFFIFSATYTGRQSLLNPTIRGVLWVIPIITIILAWTDPYHHLIYKRTWIDTLGGVEVFVAEFGAWLWLHIIYSYMLLFIGFGFLFLEMIRSPMPYRLRAGILLGGTVLPWFGSLLYFTEVLLPGVDLTVFFFLPASVLIAWGILRYQLLGTLPMAPAMVLRDMDDGILVIDIRQRILYLNRAAGEILGIRTEQALGQPLETLLPDIVELYQQLVEKQEPYIEKEFKVNGSNRMFDIRLSQVTADDARSKSAEQGNLIVFRDIHRRKKTEIELKNREAILGAINMAAQQFLRTSAWEPNIPAFLEGLGRAVGVGRTFVFQNYSENRGRLHTRLKYEWTSSEIQEQIGDQSFQSIPITCLGPEIWSEQLRQQKLVTAVTSQLKPPDNQDLMERKVRSTALVPIFVEENWWGFLGLEDFINERSWENTELEALQAAADIVGAAEVRVRNESALISRQRTLSLQHEIVLSALQTSSLDVMAQNLVDHLEALIHADGCLITLWDETEKKTLPLAASGKQHEIYQTQPQFIGENTLTAAVLKSGAPLVIEDTTSPDFRKKIPSQDFPFRSVLVLPLIAGQKRLGAIQLVYEDLHRFQPEEITNSEQAAGLIALSLEKFQAVEDASRRADESETIRMASASVVETLRSEEAIHRVLDQLLLVVPYDSASVQLLRENELEIVGGRGWDDPNAVIGLRFPIPGDNPNSVVIQTGKPYILENAEQVYEAFKEGPHSHIRSWMGVPLNVNGQVIGLLAIDSTHPNFYNADHEKTVSTFADHVAIALENARLFETAEKNSKQQAALLRLSTDLSTPTIEAEVYQRMTRGLHDALGYDHIGVFMIEEATGDRILQASFGWPEAPKNWRLPVGKGVSEDPIRDGQLHYLPDVSKEPRYITGINGSGSEVDLPIWIGENIGAVLSVESKKSYAFKQDDLDLLTVAANLAGLALTRARLFEATNQQAKQQAALFQLSNDLATRLDEQVICQGVVDALHKKLGFTHVGLFIVDESTGERVLQAGTSKVNDAFVIRIPPGQGLCELPLLDQELHYTPDVRKEPGYIAATNGSEVDVPVHIGDVVGGVLVAENEQTDAFDQSDFDLLSAVANLTGLALTRGKLFSAERKQFEELAVLHAMAMAITEATDEGQLLERATQVIGENLHLDNFGILLLDDTSAALKIHSSYHIHKELLESVNLVPLGQGIVGHVVETGIPENVADVSLCPYYLDLDSNTQSELAVPLMLGNRVIGAINAERKHLNAFSSADERLLITLAGQLATAISRMRTTEMERQRTNQLAHSNALIEALGQVAARIGSAPDLSSIFETLGQELQKLDFICLVALFNKEKQIFEIRYTSLDKRIIRLFERMTGYGMGEYSVPAGSLSEHIDIAIQPRPIILADPVGATADLLGGMPRAMISHLYQKMDMQEDSSVAHFPLIVEDEVQGFLWLWGETLDVEDLPALSIFADQVAIAVENARLFEETQKRLREQTILREAGTIISSALDSNTTLMRLCEQLGRAINMTSTYINKIDDQSGFVIIAEYFSPEACKEEKVSDVGVTYSVEQTGKRFVARMKAGQHVITHIDDRDISKFDSEHMQQFGAKSILYIPLLVKGQFTGFAELWESRRRREFSVDEINLCFLLAQQAANSIENARLFEEVQNLALMDTLTGLYNRRGLFEIGSIEFARAIRLKRPFSVIMIDIDHFKHVNDKHGHPAGDQALQGLANHLRAITRDIDIVGRYGGEEFTFLLADLDSKGAMEMAERLRKNVEKTTMKTDAGEVKLTISLGVAEYNENNPDLKTLVTRADQALYVAKHKGRNRVALGK